MSTNETNVVTTLENPSVHATKRKRPTDQPLDHHPDAAGVSTLDHHPDRADSAPQDSQTGGAKVTTRDHHPDGAGGVTPLDHHPDGAE
ncbi:hypothetical protein [Streptomyces youssoufiensis]